MRISEVNNLYEGINGHTPSVAFKFLLDGVESENIFGQYNLLPIDSNFNFFDENMSNRLFVKEDLELEEL